MNKKGISLLYIYTFYLFLVIVIFVALYGKVVASKDDTGYSLEFYAKDIAYGVEGMLWSDGNVSYVYPLKEKYEVWIDNGAGYVHVRKGLSEDKHPFRVRDGYYVSAKPNLEFLNMANPYTLTKMVREI
jgi:hypothetical protein